MSHAQTILVAPNRSLADWIRRRDKDLGNARIVLKPESVLELNESSKIVVFQMRGISTAMLEALAPFAERDQIEIRD